jgi:multidrug efflux pump subunit AcrA (membrane-fusion protein)
MKSITKFLSNPKSILPIFAIVALAGTFFLWQHVGVAPTVPSLLTNSSPGVTISDGGNIALSFQKSGRIESVFVKEGDRVKTGATLARLSAPDALGLVNQARGALDLARAQYASLNVEYANTKKQQDLIVENAYKTLLSGGLEGVPSKQDLNIPVITGNYICGKEGSYILKPYRSNDKDSGFSANFSGLESGTIPVKYDSPVPLGNCGLEIKFTHAEAFSSNTVWTVAIPNTKGSVYVANKNAYDLAVTNRTKVLDDLLAKIGSTSGASVARAQVEAAEGAYQAALGAYQNNVIIAPTSGTVTFVDPNLKVGQSATGGKPVISISNQ